MLEINQVYYCRLFTKHTIIIAIYKDNKNRNYFKIEKFECLGEETYTGGEKNG